MEDRDIVALYWKRDQQAITSTQEKYGAYCYAIAHNILAATPIPRSASTIRISRPGTPCRPVSPGF